MKKKIIEIFANQGIFINENEIEGVAEAMKETLEVLADNIEKNEPYATTSIEQYREVAIGIVNEILQAD